MYVDTIKLVLTFKKKKKWTTEDRIHIKKKIVTDIVASDLPDRIALEKRFLGVPTARKIS